MEYSQEELAKQLAEQEEHLIKEPKPSIGNKIIEDPNIKKPWEKSQDQISLQNNIGWLNIPLNDLPTYGMFYPDGTEIVIRAATTAEIRHWSSIQSNIFVLDDMLNYILERCVVIKFPNSQHSSWKDIKEVDRFYLIIAVREFTFIKGENALQVKITENKKVNITKDMISYITFDEKLMQYYNEETKSINLKFKTGEELIINLPCVGVTTWIKNYINKKRQKQESFDESFADYASYLIKDWRGLKDEVYEQYAYDYTTWSLDKLSMMSYITDIFKDSINPVINYIDEGGTELSVPLNFLGGFKSLFLISDPFGKLV
jgi:hypothetical protein